ncbi:MAG: hypothetical protein VKJ86_02845 [Synechococcus sp.]|nr:hypothetical protein [Synechococcus sp.]
MVIALAIMQHGSVIEDIGCLVVKDIYQDPEDALTQTILSDVNLNP